MTPELTAARRRLQAAGLTVRTPTDDSLWVAGQMTPVETGLSMSQDACAIRRRGNGEYVGVFPSETEVLVEVPGTVPDLVSLVLATYLRHRRQGGAFGDAVGVVLRESDQWRLAGAV
jgi:hypothetical protein